MAFIDFDEQLPVLHADEGSHVKCYLWDELTNDTFQMSKLGWRTVQSKQEALESTWAGSVCAVQSDGGT